MNSRDPISESECWAFVSERDDEEYPPLLAGVKGPFILHPICVHEADGTGVISVTTRSAHVDFL